MIQATDLRIGTAFEYNTSEGWELNIIDEGDISLCVYENKYFNEHYRPIPITEDILLKCGFEKHESLILDTYTKSINWNNDYKVLSVAVQKHNQYMWIREQNDEDKDNRLADAIICIFNSDIHGELFVHKIQNAFKEIINKELIINL